MENFIVIALGIVIFISKVYSNFKKEQEKAARRNPSMRPDSRPDVPRREASRPNQPELDLPKWLEDLFVPPAAEKPAPQPRVDAYPPKKPTLSPAKPEKKNYGSIEYEPVRYEPTEKPEDLLKEYRNRSDKKEIEELKRSVAIHRDHGHAFKRLEPFRLEKTPDAASGPLGFDLREAVIMKAILDRPYAD